MSRVFHASCALIWAAVATSALWSQAAVAQPKPAQQAKPAAAPAQPKAPADTGEGDVAYAAFQRGLYLTAFREATKRVDEKNDPKAMTLLGELYADGLGVPNDDKKANDWYKLAAARGDREATFALAMFRLTGRAGTADRKEGARLLGEAAKLGHIIAAYDLALLYLEGQLLPQDFTRAAELMKTASDAGNPQAQYALATFYKEGRGVKMNAPEATRLLAAAARSGYTDAEVEYAIALFNGTGVKKDERAAGEFLLRAAKKNSAPAQSRLALMYASGKGIKADPVQAARWHMIAKAGGSNDQYLEDFVQKMSPGDRTQAEDKAKPWIARMQLRGPSPFDQTQPTAQQPAQTQTLAPSEPAKP
jgi:TPR repeat protein